MDLSRLNQNQMIVGVGGIVLIISLFLNWGPGITAFDAFSGVDIILLVIGIAAVAYAGLTAAGSTTSLPPYSAALLAGLGILAAGIALSIDLETDDAEIGAWLALAAAVAIAFGAHDVTGARSGRAGNVVR